MASRAGSPSRGGAGGRQQWRSIKHQRLVVNSASITSATTVPRQAIRFHGTPDEPKRNKTKVVQSKCSPEDKATTDAIQAKPPKTLEAQSPPSPSIDSPDTLDSHGEIDLNISGVESAIGWVFSDKSLCATALQMRSKNGVILTFGASDHLIEHNEIFEQMGDRIMAAVLCKKWLEMRKRHNNLALWSYTLHSLVSNTALAERGFLLGLDAFIIKNPGTTQVSTGMMSDAFEAIVGAVFMDAGDDGLKAVHDVLEHTGFFKDL